MSKDVNSQFINKTWRLIPIAQAFSYVIIFNTVVAWLISLPPNGVFFNSFILSQCFGLTICSCFYIFARFFVINLANIWIPLLIGIAAGFLLGLLALPLINGWSSPGIIEVVSRDRQGLIINLVYALFFGVVIIYFFFSRSRIIDVNKALQEEQIKNLNNEKRVVETQLRLLQAQIEPHFLFNTLSNISSLVDTDPQQSKKMLNSLTIYLRNSLRKSREQNSSLQLELDLVRNYLDIFKVRMGERLKYHIDVEKKILQHRFSPMLLQPIVENAIKHGLEPAEAGGIIRIRATIVADKLRIQVADTGLGLQDETQSGFGLVNIRERLSSLFGEAACLRIASNKPVGVTTTIEIPYNES